MAAPDLDQMKKQTTQWCMYIPNSKKKIERMKIAFDPSTGTVKFVPNF